MTTRPGQSMMPRAAAPGSPPWPGELRFRGAWPVRESQRPYDSHEPEGEPDAEFAPEPMHFPEEDVFARMIDRSPKRPPLRRWAPALIGSVAALAVTAAAFLYFRGGPAPQPTASNSPAPTTEPLVVPASRCPAERIGDKIQGNGDGGTDSGPGAIFAFQYAYYVTRSAEQARTVVAPNASVPTVDAIQHGIDSIPAGTTHCVAITPGAFAGQYRVVITESRPGRDPMTYNAQLVSVARAGDRTLITGIAAAG